MSILPLTSQTNRFPRYENGSAYFHEDDRDGLVKVCRLVINARYEEYASEGYAVLSAKQPVIYHSASGRLGLGQHLCSQVQGKEKFNDQDSLYVIFFFFA